MTEQKLDDFYYFATIQYDLDRAKAELDHFRRGWVMDFASEQVDTGMVEAGLRMMQQRHTALQDDLDSFIRMYGFAYEADLPQGENAERNLGNRVHSFGELVEEFVAAERKV